MNGLSDFLKKMIIAKHKELYCKKCNKIRTHTYLQTVNGVKLYSCIRCLEIRQLKEVETMMNINVRLREL